MYISLLKTKTYNYTKEHYSFDEALKKLNDIIMNYEEDIKEALVLYCQYTDKRLCLDDCQVVASLKVVK